MKDKRITKERIYYEEKMRGLAPRTKEGKEAEKLRETEK
jgi:hypothetical protein